MTAKHYLICDPLLKTWCHLSMMGTKPSAHRFSLGYRLTCAGGVLHPRLNRTVGGGKPPTVGGGRLVKLKAWLALSAKALQLIGPEYHRFVSRRTLDPIDPCLVPVVGLDEGFSTRCLPAANPRWWG